MNDIQAHATKDIPAVTESVDIRYVHYMEHPDYPETLAVGCVCAEHTEGNYIRPRERESGMRLFARRRKAWADRQWMVSQLRNPFINTEVSI